MQYPSDTICWEAQLDEKVEEEAEGIWVEGEKAVESKIPKFSRHHE